MPHATATNKGPAAKAYKNGKQDTLGTKSLTLTRLTTHTIGTHVGKAGHTSYGKILNDHSFVQERTKFSKIPQIQNWARANISDLQFNTIPLSYWGSSVN